MTGFHPPEMAWVWRAGDPGADLDLAGAVLDRRAVERQRRPVVELHDAQPGMVLKGPDPTECRDPAQWTIFPRASSRMSVAPRSTSAGISVLMPAFSTTLSTA